MDKCTNEQTNTGEIIGPFGETSESKNCFYSLFMSD